MWLLTFQIIFLVSCVQLVGCYPTQSQTSCGLCKPGQYVIKECANGDDDTLCRPCTPGTYTDYENNLRSCLPCSTCTKGSNPLKQCTLTTDTICFGVVASLRVKRENSPDENAVNTVDDKDTSETAPTSKADENAPTLKAEEHSPTTKAEEASPTTKAEEASPTTKAEEASPTTKAEEASPTTKAEEASPTTKAEEASPTTKAEEDSPTTKTEEASPTTKTKPSPTTKADENTSIAEPLIQAVKMAPTENNSHTTTLPTETTVDAVTKAGTEQTENSEIVQTTPGSKVDTTEPEIDTTELEVVKPEPNNMVASEPTVEQKQNTTEPAVGDQLTGIAETTTTTAEPNEATIVMATKTEDEETQLSNTSNIPTTTAVLETTEVDNEASAVQNTGSSDNETLTTDQPPEDGNETTTQGTLILAANNPLPQPKTTIPPLGENTTTTKNNSEILNLPKSAANDVLAGNTTPEVNDQRTTTPAQEELVVEQDNPDDTKVDEVHIPSHDHVTSSTERIKTLEELELLEKDDEKEDGSGDVDGQHGEHHDNHTDGHGHEDNDDGDPHTGQAHQDTDEDTDNKKTTAIIVGTALGGVTLFTLAFFTSRHCKKKREFASIKRPAPKSDNGDYELAPLTSSHPSICVDMEHRNPNGLYRHGPKMGPPSPRMFRKNEGKFAFPETNNDQNSGLGVPLTTFSPGSQQSIEEPLLRMGVDKIKYMDESTDDELDSDAREQLLPASDLGPSQDPTDVTPESTPEAEAPVEVETNSKMAATPPESNGVGNHEGIA